MHVTACLKNLFRYGVNFRNNLDAIVGNNDYSRNIGVKKKLIQLKYDITWSFLHEFRLKKYVT